MLLRNFFLPKAEFEQILLSLRERKNIVLQGPPGWGSLLWRGALRIRSWVRLTKHESDGAVPPILFA